MESRVESLDGEGGSSTEGRLEAGDRCAKYLLLLLKVGTSADEVVVSDSGFEIEKAGTEMAGETSLLELGLDAEAGLSREGAAPGDAAAFTVLCKTDGSMAGLFGAVVMPVECCWELTLPRSSKSCSYACLDVKSRDWRPLTGVTGSMGPSLSVS